MNGQKGSRGDVRSWDGVSPALRRIAVLGVLTAAVCVGSCATSERTIVAPPRIPGAEFVGTEDCDMCHDRIVARFRTATHSIIQARNEEVGSITCESCHGPGSLHVDSEGERGTIINPRRQPETCFRCHLDKRAEFSLPHTHPVGSGPLGLARSNVSCPDCHQLHEGPAIARGAGSLAWENQTCLKCHQAQRGPFVFEHEALRDGCTVCHRPHGSVNDKLLTERNAALCLKCHFQQQALPDDLVIGGRNHPSSLTTGTCYSAGCHEAIHGSQTNSSLLY